MKDFRNLQTIDTSLDYQNLQVQSLQLQHNNKLLKNILIGTAIICIAILSINHYIENKKEEVTY
ncbi:hypothetical protein [Flavobacterium aquatile]|uniref:Uncharacterized protein n=1 Tax=Flavobacterium aquatile LMG 4008 = ATCC 11947 TaxID=1453498 RepID=A0A095U317_9FLAO|nr:hypothetical protein [Flavobacterium aquatile]KGD68988.1 hypothetical protein LG45_04950 [Flavobacterium aquatile LMG 4008 = ATCC 11947]OXA65698.1 hypothetical protein B0A61_13705 [Flavobacterium aquatile LMG 4008 = ATCC 11947]GEC78161.1 hypothetical protein FAQ01_10310 [Flavobacterium aquatile]